MIRSLISNVFYSKTNAILCRFLFLFKKVYNYLKNNYLKRLPPLKINRMTYVCVYFFFKTVTMLI